MSQPPPDLFPERPVRSEFASAGRNRSGFGRRRFLRPPSYRMRRAITVSVIALVLFLALRMVFGGASFTAPGAIATIKAEGAWKQRPEQPGGLDIPNQKVEVYQALDDTAAQPHAAEHLLPPPEVPQLSSAASPAAAPAAAAPQIENLTPPKLEIDTIPTTVIGSPSSAAVPPAPAPAPAAPPAPVTAAPAPTVAAAPAPKPSARTKPPITIEQVLKDARTTSKTDRLVQLASVPDEATARDMAGRLQTRYASILGSARLRIVKATVSGKGIYYRIQSQPLAGDKAGNICAALKQMKAGCILVRP